MTKRKLTYLLLLLFVTAFVFQSGCVYYNTFYNAKKAFNQAEKIRDKNKYTSGSGGGQQYKIAIEKALKVIENNPNTKYYDDALYVVGVSYYHTKQYGKADRRFRELLANYPESPYSKESELYLAKTKLKLREEDQAMELFENIFNADYEKSFKSEAAMGLGRYYYDNNDIVEAQPYFYAVRDSLGNDIEKKIAQKYIADGYFTLFKFDDALSAYLQIIGMNPNKNEKYHALFSASEAAYNLLRIDEGIDYLNTLMDDEVYFDSVGTLKLAIAKGYDYDGEYESAEEIYLSLAEDEDSKRVASEANYQLGLMAQFDKDDLVLAKEYYDKAAKLYRSSDAGKDALQRSADIGKLETFARTLKIDSTTTQENIDDAAFTQIRLARLYWLSLDKPDTAIIEMQYVVDSFPTAYDAPSALIALSQMYREYKEDSTAADSILHLVLERYPNSDRVAEVIKLLDLQGTAADTGYAQLYLHKAENFLVDGNNKDSAKYYYQYIIDNFPESDLYLQARFALLWIEEEYESPGDSSLFFAYNAFVDSFPSSPWAREAGNIVKAANREKQREEYANAKEADTLGENLLANKQGDSTAVDENGEYMDPYDAMYIDPQGNKAYQMLNPPVEIRRKFVYPEQAYNSDWEGDLYFQILLDFSGEVSDYVLKIRSPNEAIDLEASETVATMVFDILDIPQELADVWWVYKFRVVKPDKLR